MSYGSTQGEFKVFTVYIPSIQRECVYKYLLQNKFFIPSSSDSNKSQCELLKDFPSYGKYFPFKRPNLLWLGIVSMSSGWISVGNIAVFNNKFSNCSSVSFSLSKKQESSSIFHIFSKCLSFP